MESVEGYEPLRLLDYGRLFHLLENGHYFNAVNRFSQLEDVNPKYLSALNVKYFFILKQNQTTSIQKKLFDYGFKPVFEEGRVQVLENPHVLPRAYFVNQIAVSSSQQDLAAKLEDPAFDPAHTAIITSRSNLEVATFITSRSNLEVTRHSDNNVIIKTSADSDQFMVLADSFDTGWKLKLDGQPGKIYQTNGALRGVFVPAGTHSLTFNYLPDSFIFGAVISLLSAILTFALALRYH